MAHKLTPKLKNHLTLLLFSKLVHKSNYWDQSVPAPLPNIGQTKIRNVRSEPPGCENVDQQVLLCLSLHHILLLCQHRGTVGHLTTKNVMDILRTTNIELQWTYLMSQLKQMVQNYRKKKHQFFLYSQFGPSFFGVLVSNPTQQDHTVWAVCEVIILLCVWRKINVVSVEAPASLQFEHLRPNINVNQKWQ